ncbi:phospholipase D-like domain-containing protein [Roseibium salinum]|nr:phospholipase D-like domain-containing protein [Roseibium salinum]
MRVYYPLAARTDGDRHEVEILVHSKVLIVDDRILRVGSSNLNNRSFGIDTECDLVIEADDEATAETIRRQCRGLMADLAGVSVAALDEAVRSEGSFLRGLDRLAARTGRLKAFFSHARGGPHRTIARYALLRSARTVRAALGDASPQRRGRRFVSRVHSAERPPERLGGDHSIGNEDQRDRMSGRHATRNSTVESRVLHRPDCFQSILLCEVEIFLYKKTFFSFRNFFQRRVVV